MPYGTDGLVVNNSNNDVQGGEQKVFKNSVIVNYLPRNMTQDEMRSLFSVVGEIESCKLIIDKMTGQSLSYGFINYERAEDAAQAVNKFNGFKLQSKTLRVAPARPSSDAIKGTNLYISGLPNDITQQQLESMFTSYGRIITSRILSESGNSGQGNTRNRKITTSAASGVGFVRLDQRSEAERAIEELNGTIPKGCAEPITVKFANNPYKKNKTSDTSFTSTPQSNFTGPIQRANSRFRYSPLDREMATNFIPGTGTCLFVYNLVPETEESSLWKLFGPFGAVLNVKIICDLQTNKCKGFGFVTMANYEDAAMAVQSLNGSMLNNRILQVSFKTNKNKNA